MGEVPTFQNSCRYSLCPYLSYIPVPPRCALRLTPAQTIAEWAREYSREKVKTCTEFLADTANRGPKIFELSPVGSGSHVPPPITNLEHSDAWAICTRFFAVKRTSVLFRAF